MIRNVLLVGAIVLVVLGVCHQRHDVKQRQKLGKQIDEIIMISKDISLLNEAYRVYRDNIWSTCGKELINDRG